MCNSTISRRNCIALLGAAASPAAHTVAADGPTGASEQADRIRRMKWWHDAKFGMFIHIGLYSVLGRHEWVMEHEGIPTDEYERLAERFIPKPGAARNWAKLARRAGQKYMVMGTKHHEGFCLFSTKYTDYCAPKQACGRDLAREYVEAARAEGLRVGFYYSLMDWHHPDGARCATDEAARKRFVEYTHGQVRELCSNYGKVDILWYDSPSPLDAKGFESERMNRMVRQLQPDIIINDRSGTREDFGTPEQSIVAEGGGRAWEACMTLNDSWGYNSGDDAWRSPKTILRNLISCARDGGNYLLNIGPRGDGSVPEESVSILHAVGTWMAKHGATIHGTEPCKVTRSAYLNFTRKGNTLYVHVPFWPGPTVTVGGLLTPVKSARFFATGMKIDFQQDRFRLRLTGLPEKAPEELITVLAVECESEPAQDTWLIRGLRERKRV